MSEIKMTNIPSMNIGKVVSQLTEAYSSVIKSNLPFDFNVLLNPCNVCANNSVGICISEQFDNIPSNFWSGKVIFVISIFLIFTFGYLFLASAIIPSEKSIP